MTPTEIRRARLHLGLSQSEVAQLLDVDPVTWNRWEKGKQNPRYPRILERALHDLIRERERPDFDPGLRNLPD